MPSSTKLLSFMLLFVGLTHGANITVFLRLYCSRNKYYCCEWPSIPFMGYAELMEEDIITDDQISRRTGFKTRESGCVDVTLHGSDTDDWSSLDHHLEPFVRVVHTCHEWEKITHIHLPQIEISSRSHNFTIDYDLATETSGVRMEGDKSCTFDIIY